MPQTVPAKPALLCITPYFGNSVPPAGAAALLAYLRASGCDDFAFTDFRTWLPYRCQTFSEMGAFAETFVLDVPELPIVLKLLRAFREGKPSVVPERDRMFDDYCMRRLLNPKYVHQYLVTLESFFAGAWQERSRIDFVGFTTWTTNYLSTLIAAAQLKRANPGAYVVAGGPQVTESVNSAQLGLAAGIFDAVVSGEGEQPLLDLYTEFAENGRKPGSAAIPGVLKREVSEEADPSDKRKLLLLKNLPAPRFDEIDLTAYQGWRDHRMLPYQLSRGCTDKCSFCSEWVFWQNFRLSKPDASVEQIGELKQRYGVEHISFTDSLINGVERRLEMFADQLLTSGTQVTWGGFMRAQMTPDLASLISRAGCKFAFVGVESLSDETLDSMNKRKTGVENVKAIEAFAGANVPVEVGLITGFPGDSPERFMDTVRGVMALQSRYPGRVRVNVEPFRPTPNQPIYKDMRDYGLEPALWDDATLDLDPEVADITSQIYCSVSGSNQGVDRLGEQQYVSKVIRSGPKPAGEFTIGWGRPQILDFEHEFVKFKPFGAADLRGFYSVRALHPDGSVRFLILSADEARQLSPVVSDVTFGTSPFETEDFSSRWSAYEEAHVIPGAMHPDKVGSHHFAAGLEASDYLCASPYWTARIVDGGEEGLAFHYLYDVARAYRTSPMLAPTLEALKSRPIAQEDAIARTLAEAGGLDSDDVAEVFRSVHELGFLSVV